MEVSTSKRSNQLIANFVDGYAEGWFMRVPECFKRELDIQLTPRINPDIWGLYIIPAKKAMSGLSSSIANSALSSIKQIEEQTERIVVWGNKKSNESFDQLVIQTIDLIKRTKDKDALSSIARKKTQVWTQGSRYCFAKDYIIHSADNKHSIQILSAIPSEIETQNDCKQNICINYGIVKFAIYRLTAGKNVKINEQTLNQKEFVHFLRYGNNDLDQNNEFTKSASHYQPSFEW